MNWTRNPFNLTFNPCFTREAYLIFMYKICKIKKEHDLNDEQGSLNLFRSMSRRSEMIQKGVKFVRRHEFLMKLWSFTFKTSSISLWIYF